MDSQMPNSLVTLRLDMGQTEIPAIEDHIKIVSPRREERKVKHRRQSVKKRKTADDSSPETSIDFYVHDTSDKGEQKMLRRNVTGLLGDSSEYDTDLDDVACAVDQKDKEAEAETSLGLALRTYLTVCRSLAIIPVKKIIEQLDSNTMRLHHVGLNSNDCKALACSLWHVKGLEALDLEDNGLGSDGLVPIINAIKNNNSISSLSLSENVLDIVGAMAVDDVLHQNTWLTHLNLSGTRLGDKEIEYIAAGIQNNESLRWLNMSHNEIGIIGAKKLGSALGSTPCLKFLNLSWNHIRLSGAVSLCKGLKTNCSIVNLDISWNGLGYEGSLALEGLLRENDTIKVLNVSNNRINWECVSYVARGIKRNNTLQMLKIGYNPLNMEGCYELMKAVSFSKCNISYIGLDSIPINGAVLRVVDDILRARPHFTFTHGGILDTRDIVGIRKEKREDPVSLLVRYLAMIGIRVIDLFRMFDIDNNGLVTKHCFIQGLQKIGAPLGKDGFKNIADRFTKQYGHVTYRSLSRSVRNHIREERMATRRQEVRQKNKQDERRRILQSELPPIYRRSYGDDAGGLWSSSAVGRLTSPSSSTSSLRSASGTRYMSLPPLHGRSSRSASESNINKPGSTLLPPVSRSNSVSDPYISNQQPESNSYSRRESLAVPSTSALKKPKRLLAYVNAYLHRRKSQAQFEWNVPMSSEHNSKTIYE